MRAWSKVAAVAMAVGFAASTANAEQKQFSIATGTTGGTYYPLGGAMANILSKQVPGWAVTAEATNGSVANLHMIRDGKAELALTQADTSYDAAKGQDKFAGKAVPHRALAVVYPNLMHFVTMEGTGIETLADIKGKRVSTASPVSGSEVIAFRIMEAMGLTNSDIRRERLAPAESTAAMKDGKLDGYFFAGGPPIAAVTDLAATQGVKIKLVDYDELVPKITAKYGPVYSKGAIKAGSYPGQDKDAKVLAIWNLLVVNAAMSDQEAYTITKTVWEAREDLVATHKAALDMTPENQKAANSPVPFHPGALKYFAEKGIAVE